MSKTLLGCYFTDHNANLHETAVGYDDTSPVIDHGRVIYSQRNILLSLRETIARHNRETDIEFEPEGHIYTYRGKRLKAVTKLLKTFFNPFDSTAMAVRMSQSQHRPNYFGRSPQSILAEWEASNAASLQKGILLHDEIDRYLGGKLQAQNATSPHFEGFLAYWRTFCPQHAASEQILFDAERGLAGTLDEIAVLDGGVLLCDWKTSKSNIHKHHNKRGLGPIAHLPASAFTRYSLQLNLYAFLFFQTFGIKVNHMHIVLIQNNRFEKVDAPWMRAEVAAILGTDTIDY